ncbi:MAG: VWA domain-containing protein [Phycisphaerales bacterium]
MSWLPVVFRDPAWLAVVLVSAPLAVLGAKWFVAMSRWRRASAILARVVLFTLIAALLAGASAVRETRRLAVVGVVDLSGSVKRFTNFTGADTGAPIDPSDAVRAYLARATQGREADDLLGLLAFDDRALAVATPSAADVLDRPLNAPGSSGTNIEQALRRAAAMIPPDAAGRIVLFSDGVQTEGDAAKAAGELATLARSATGGAGGIAVDVVPFKYNVRSEVVVESLDAPPRAAGESTVTLRVVLRASAPATGTLSVTREGEVVDLDPDPAYTGRRLALEPGTHVELVDVDLPPGSVHRFEAVFEPDADPATGAIASDTVLENNRARAFTITPGRGSVLIVQGQGIQSTAEGSRLARTLRESGLDVQTADPGSLTPDLLALQAHDLVILQNVPADAVDLHAQEALGAYVRDLGGGLVMVGGPDSFGAGGWKGSPLEPILPVKLDLPEQLVVPEAAIVFVLDNSGSMAGSVLGSARSQQQIANEAAALAIRSLDARDLVGVVTFNSSANLVLPLAKNTEPERAVSAVESISSGGGTNLVPALEMAFKQLVNVDAKLRHVIVLSDGRSRDEQILPELAQEMYDEGIRVSTIAVGDGADLVTMHAIADRGHGVFYNVVNPSVLPRIFLKAVRVIRSPLVREQPFDVVVLPTGSPLIEGLGQPPRLDGLVLTQARDEPTITYAMSTPTGEPVLAHWSVGLGQVAAFTSDADRWAERWLDWDGYRRFWTQTARLIGRPPSQSDAELSVVVDAGRLRLRMSAYDDHGQPIDMLDAPATVYTPSGRPEEVTLTQTGPGVYEGSVPATESGSYVSVIKPKLEGRRLPPVLGGASISGGVEYRRLESDVGALSRIASAGRGRVLDLGDPDGADLFDRASVPVQRALIPIWPMLLAWTLFVFLLDVGTRRVAWDRLIGREFGPGVIRRAREAVEDRTHRAHRATESLRTKRAARASPQITTRSPALGDADAARVVAEARKKRMEAHKARLKEIREQSREGEILPGPASEKLSGRPPKAKTDTKTENDAPESGAADLLAAKRRARSRYETPDDDKPST